MTAHAKAVFEDAMKLTDKEREELANELWESLPLMEPVDEEADPGAEAAWDAEIDRRIAEIDSGKIVGVDPFKMIEDIKARLR